MSATISKSFPVTGLSCASCALNVEKRLKSQAGVLTASVSFASSSALIEYIPSDTSAAVLKSAIQSIGYDLLIEESGNKEQEEKEGSEYRKLKSRAFWSSVFSLPVFLISMFFMNIPGANYILFILASPVVIWFGRQFFINAYKQARHGQANMDTLVALSTGIAYLFSSFNTFFPAVWHRYGIHAHVYFEASTVVICFIILGKLLEEKAKAGTSSALKKLMGLQPSIVILINEEGVSSERTIQEVKTGDTILVRPGDRVPVDGAVKSGVTFIDESSITGESLPAEKTEGSKVYAGTLNQNGSFTMSATKVGGDSVLGQIIRQVKQAQGSKAPVQKFVDKIAGIFVPSVLGISVLTFIVWIIAGGENSLVHAILAAVTVLLIACPCALGLATPTAISVGIGRGAESGILVRDAESLENAHKITTVVLDKTGTITEGKPSVTDSAWFTEESRKPGLKRILYSAEINSGHPLAEAVVNELSSSAFSALEPDKFENIPGRGVKLFVGKTLYLAGNPELIMENNVEISAEQGSKIRDWQLQAKSVVCFAEGKNLVALFAVSDKIKESSAGAIKELQKMGIKVHMITGDNKQTAEQIAAAAGITEYSWSALPADKSTLIRKLKQEGEVVAMVGDGINDSEALAIADVGIAMGQGSEIAMDTAKMTIISSDLRLIREAIVLSAETNRIIRQNLFWAFIYNLVALPVAAGILYPFWGYLLNPMIAGAAMALSSVSVVSNSLRLKLRKAHTA